MDRAPHDTSEKECTVPVERKSYQPDGLVRRVVGGNLLYSHALSITGGERLVYVSGQVSRDQAGNVVGVGDMSAQIERVCENIRIALEAAGAGWEHVVRTTTYCTDLDAFFSHADVRMRYFGLALPASSTIGITRLSHPDFLVEIDATAIL